MLRLTNKTLPPLAAIFNSVNTIKGYRKTIIVYVSKPMDAQPSSNYRLVKLSLIGKARIIWDELTVFLHTHRLQYGTNRHFI